MSAALGSVPRSLKDPATTVAVNVMGTAHVFTAARDAGVQRIVYASSSSVYGDSAVVPKREGEEGRPLSPYSASKKMNEQLAEVFSSRHRRQVSLYLVARLEGSNVVARIDSLGLVSSVQRAAVPSVRDRVNEVQLPGSSLSIVSCNRRVNCPTPQVMCGPAPTNSA